MRQIGLMSERMTRFFGSYKGIVVVGALLGLLSSLLQRFGNPPNMGICVASFVGDIAGALGLYHTKAALQVPSGIAGTCFERYVVAELQRQQVSIAHYIRPELVGFVLGSTVAALLFHEFRPRMGSSPAVRFLLGMVGMIGALTFIGCPWRALLRLAGGDLNAVPGLAGLIVGIGIATQMLNRGFRLGKSQRTRAWVGWIMPATMLGLLLLLILRPLVTEGRVTLLGSSASTWLGAPLPVSLAVGLIIGFLAQRTSFCTIGPICNTMIVGNIRLLGGVGALVAGAFATNLILRQVHIGFAGQPAAHSNYLWNFMGMVLSGLAFMLAGGCPARQLFLAGEGDVDAVVFVLGMFTGAALAYNFGLVAATDTIVAGAVKVGGPATNGIIAVLAGLLVSLMIGIGVVKGKRGRSILTAPLDCERNDRIGA